MKVIVIIVTSLMAIALACPPPLNNPDILPNATHTTDYLIKAALEQTGGLGWADTVKPFRNPVHPWPRSRSGEVTTIWYRYADEASKNELYDMVEAALALWRREIGTPGNRNGHSLVVNEFPAQIPSQPYCYFQSGPSKGLWNIQMPNGTLVVLKERDPNHGTAARASLGYWPEGRPDRHGISINRTKIHVSDGPCIIAHEFINLAVSKPATILPTDVL